MCYGDYTSPAYGGAPDECNVHWPTKLGEDGYCPIEGCPMSRKEDDNHELTDE